MDGSAAGPLFRPAAPDGRPAAKPLQARNPRLAAQFCSAMEAARLRKLAAQCRDIAATLSSDHIAETLRGMAREFEASAEFSEKMPVITSRAGRRDGR